MYDVLTLCQAHRYLENLRKTLVFYQWCKGSFSGEGTLMLAVHGLEDSGLCLPSLLCLQSLLSVPACALWTATQCLQEAGEDWGHSIPGRDFLTEMEIKPVAQTSDLVCVQQWWKPGVLPMV